MEEADLTKSGPCASCSEFVSLSAAICPLCAEPTGFSGLTRLRASPRRLLAIVGVVVVVVSGISYGAGKVLGARDAAETKEYVDSNQTLEPEAIERAREAELEIQRQLRQEIAAEEAKLEELGEARRELERLRAELESLPDEDRLRRARQARQAAFAELMKEPR